VTRSDDAVGGDAEDAVVLLFDARLLVTELLTRRLQFNIALRWLRSLLLQFLKTDAGHQASGDTLPTCHRTLEDEHQHQRIQRSARELTEVHSPVLH
jgi:hypothetical protein